MRKAVLSLITILLFSTLSGGPALACVGVPDLDMSVVWQAFEGLATLLVVPDGSGLPLTEARTAEGAVVDATIHVTIIGNCNEIDPIVDFPREDIWLESMAGGLTVCQGGSLADTNTDAEGHTQWTQPLMAGGYDEGNCRVVINGAPAGPSEGQTLNFNSPDMNGDGDINITDVYRFSVDYFGDFEFRADLHRDGEVNLSDLSILAGSLGMSCP